jgi:hypothetical protein
MTKADPRAVRLFLGYLLACYAIVASAIATIAALLTTSLITVEGVTPLEEFVAIAGVFFIAASVLGARIFRALEDRSGGAR